MFYQNCVFGCCKDVSLVDHLRWQSCWIVTQWQCMTAGRSGCLSRNRGFSGCTCQQWDMYCFKYSWENEKGIDLKNVVKQSGNFICNISWGKIKHLLSKKEWTVKVWHYTPCTSYTIISRCNSNLNYVLYLTCETVESSSHETIVYSVRWAWSKKGCALQKWPWENLKVTEGDTAIFPQALLFLTSRLTN